MAKFLDYRISPITIEIVDRKVDRSKLRIKSLSVKQYGHLPNRTSKKELAYGHFMAFTYISRGSGTFQTRNGPVQQLVAGSLFWEWPDESSQFGPTAHEDWDEYYVVIEGTRVQEWLDNGIIPDKHSVMYVGVDPLWISKFEAIGAYLESGVPDHADRASLLVESLVYDFFQAHITFHEGHHHAHKKEIVLQVLEDISNSLYLPWNEKDIWERNHISRSTLRRIVQQNTGFPLNEYVNRLKIAEAKKLLNHTALQIKEIASTLGFEDVSYFSRLFKKYAHTSASSYRRSNEH